MFNILNKKLLLILAPIVVFSFFAVNDALAYSAGDIQKVPDGYGLTAIGYGSDDTQYQIRIQTAPVDSAGNVNHHVIHETSVQTGNYSEQEKSFSQEDPWKVISGWSWNANTSGGHGGKSGNPSDECYYQEYAPLTNINNRSGWVSHENGRYPGTCHERGYQEDWIHIARAPEGEVIVGISKFGLHNDADVTALAVAYNVVYNSPTVVEKKTGFGGQNYYDYESSATQGSPVQTETNKSVYLIVSELSGDWGDLGNYTWSTTDNSAYFEKWNGFGTTKVGVSSNSQNPASGYFFRVKDGSSYTATGILMGFTTPGLKTVTFTNSKGKTGRAYVNVVAAPEPIIDVCPNIAGVQVSIPAGKIKDASGNCVDPYVAPTCQITAPAAADRYVNTPIAVKAAGGDGVYSWEVSDGDIVSSGADTAAASFNSPGDKIIKVKSAEMEGLCPPVTIKTPPVIDVCPNIEGVQAEVPEGMVKDDTGNCITPPGPIPPTKPSCKVVPAPGETNIVKKIFAQIGLGKIGEPVYFQGSGGDQASYSWSKFIPDNSFSIDPLVSDSLTTILAQTSGLKMLKVSSGGLSSDMCWAIIQGEPEPSAPTCSFESVPWVDQVPGKLLAVNASGGTGTYSWSVLTAGSITPVDADSASAVFENSGNNIARVSSGSKTGQCSIFLREVPEEPEPESEVFPDVTCLPSEQSAGVGQTVSFTAGGGDGNYAWSVSDSSGNTATASFGSSGLKNVVVSSAGDSAVCRVNVSRPAPTVNIWIDGGSEILLPNNDFTVNWSSSNAESCNVSGPSLSSSATSGSQTFNDKARGSYDFSITCQNESGSASANTSVSIKEVPFCSFTANPANIVPPQKSTLNWSCQYASGGCSIEGIGGVAANGSKEVQLKQTTNYVLACVGADGNSRNEATVTIDFIPWLKEIIPIW